MNFINWWKDKCSAMLKAGPFLRKKIGKDINIMDDEIQSRYEKTHGEDGLCFAVVELFNAMAELRMKAEYGDYLAYTCLALKDERMDDMIWKIEKLDWQEVAARIQAEEATRADDKLRRRSVPTPTPYLDNIAIAASRLEYEESLVRYQIIAYAERNNFCHSGVKAMAQNGYFEELGERILEDLRSLDVIFRSRPHDQIEMRSLIKIVEREWFKRLWVEDTGKRRVRYNLTEKGIKKMQSARPPGEAE